MGARLHVAPERVTKPAVAYVVSLAVCACWIAMLAAGCATPQSIDCAPDEVLNADGTRCKLIPCNGGEIENKVCVCPPTRFSTVVCA